MPANYRCHGQKGNNQPIVTVNLPYSLPTPELPGRGEEGKAGQFARLRNRPAAILAVLSFLTHKILFVGKFTVTHKVAQIVATPKSPKDARASIKTCLRQDTQQKHSWGFVF